MLRNEADAEDAAIISVSEWELIRGMVGIAFYSACFRVWIFSARTRIIQLF